MIKKAHIYNCYVMYNFKSHIKQGKSHQKELSTILQKHQPYPKLNALKLKCWKIICQISCSVEHWIKSIQFNNSFFKKTKLINIFLGDNWQQ